MAERKTTTRKVSAAGTRKEMMESYNSHLQDLQERKEDELKPQEKREEIKAKEALVAADALTAEGIVQRIGTLKLDIGKMLSQIAETLGTEVDKLEGMKRAIAFREKEIQELYQIDRTAETLAALIEAQNIRRQDFEEEMAAKKGELEQEIEVLRSQWESDKQQRDAEGKEWAAAEKKRREREKEEFGYAFERERTLVMDKFADEKAKLEKEIQLSKEQAERALEEREKVIAEREAELGDLRKKAAAFPKEMETTVSQAVKDATDRLTYTSKSKEELMKKEFEGEKNVLNTRIQALEKMTKDQSEQITRLTGQLDKAYQKIEDVAVKTIEGSSNLQTLTSLQHMLGDQFKKPSPDR